MAGVLPYLTAYDFHRLLYLCMCAGLCIYVWYMSVCVGVWVCVEARGWVSQLFSTLFFETESLSDLELTNLAAQRTPRILLYAFPALVLF